MAKDTRIPIKNEGTHDEVKREQIDSENFMELKKYVNLYSKDKLVRKSEFHQTTWDKFKGLNQKAAKADDIDFDFQSFKQSCINGKLRNSAKYDGVELLK